MTIARREKGSRMSQSVVHGSTVYLSGQVGEGASVAKQAADMLANVDRRLEAAGTDKSHVLSATIWLANMGDFVALNAVWDAWIDPENPPARACVEARLATPKYLVEVMVIAALD